MMNPVLRHRHRQRRQLGWIAGVVAGALVLGGASGAYLRYGRDTCGGKPVTLTVVTSPDQFTLMNRLADEWNAKKPSVGGRCTSVTIRPMPSGVVAASLGPRWDEQRDGVRPDVWAPDASAWLMVTSSRPDAAALLPQSAPTSLASSPVVLAMQQPMAQALGWPNREIGWTDLLGGFARGQTWARFGHPEWGPLRLGTADPTKSTAGMAGVLTVLDLDNDNKMGDQELFGAVAFSQLVTSYAEDTDTLLRSYVAPGAAEKAATLPAGFPVLERDLAQYASGSPAIPLVPIYLREGPAFADYPFVVLRAPWVDDLRQRTAAEFLAYLRSPAGQQAYNDAGFRAPDRTAVNTALLSPQRGFRLQLAAPTRVPTVETFGQLLGMWSVLQRPNNVLVALDTSGSMKDPVPGTGMTRLQLLQRAAVEGIVLLTNQTVVGLWEFSTNLTPTTDYRELVPVGLAGDAVPGGMNRRQAMVSAIQHLQANGGTGLYDTIYAAYQRMQQAWQPNAQNFLFVITDGKNEDRAGLTLPQLTAQLKQAVRPDRPLPIVGIAVGPEADANALNEVTKVTGGRTVIARDDVSAIQQIVLAFAGRIS
jgi:Ca-activated chloride channel family protein